MIQRRVSLVLAFLFCAVSFAVSQKTDLYVNVSFEDNTPAKYSYKVQLMTSTRMRVGMDLTNDRGQAIFRGLDAGDYRALISGPDIDEIEIGFIVESHAGSMMNIDQNEHVTVRRRMASQSTSTEGSVSASTLKVPDNARKEFDEGQAALNQRDFAGAKEHFSKAAELYPQYCGALVGPWHSCHARAKN